MLDFRIETFLAVCGHMNYTKAAEALHITQPAVSQHIRHLEQEYGVKLFACQGKRIRLTEAGQELLHAATTMKHDAIHLKDRMARIAQQGRGLVFGATLTVGEYVMPEALSRYLSRYPQAAVHMVVADTKELLGKLDAGEIDFAVVEGFFQRSEYESLVYGREPFVAVCAPGHRLAGESVRAEDLLGERLIVRESGSGTRNVLERYLEGRNLMVDDFLNLVEINSLQAIKSLVAMGKGIAFLYEAAVRMELEEGTLKRLRLPDFEIVHDFTFIWRKGSIFGEDYGQLFKALHGGR